MRDGPLNRYCREHAFTRGGQYLFEIFHEKGSAPLSNSYALIGNYQPVSSLQGVTLSLLTSCSSALR